VVDPVSRRNYPQAWRSSDSMQEAIAASRFGVDLVDPVDHYHMADRSVKYAGLFILLTLAAIWLIEVLAGLRVHPIQYLLLGSALCLFYLLELSLSEHLGPALLRDREHRRGGDGDRLLRVILHRTARALIVAPA